MKHTNTEHTVNWDNPQQSKYEEINLSRLICLRIKYVIVGLLGFFCALHASGKYPYSTSLHTEARIKHLSKNNLTTEKPPLILSHLAPYFLYSLPVHHNRMDIKTTVSIHKLSTSSHKLRFVPKVQ